MPASCVNVEDDRARWFWFSPLAGGLVGVAFVWAGIAKTIEPSMAARAIQAVRLSPVVADAVLLILPPLEIAVGLALLLSWRSFALFVCSFTLLAVFSTFLVLLHLVNERALCGCFGALFDRVSGGGLAFGLTRNGVLAALLGVAAIHIFRDTLPARKMP